MAGSDWEPWNTAVKYQLQGKRPIKEYISLGSFFYSNGEIYLNFTALILFIKA